MAGTRVKKEKSQDRSAVGANHQTAGALPRIELATWQSASHVSLGTWSMGCVGQLKKWATMWMVERQSGQVGSSAPPAERREDPSLNQWPDQTWESLSQSACGSLCTNDYSVVRGLGMREMVLGRWSDPRVDHFTSGRGCLLRRAMSGEEGWPWEVSCKLLVASSSTSPLAVAVSYPVLKNQKGWWALKSPTTIWSHGSPGERQCRGQDNAGDT